MCENSGLGSGGLASQTEPRNIFTLLSHTDLGLATVKHYSCLDPYWEHWYIRVLTEMSRTERKFITWLFHSALPVLTCGAITRKCDPGASERRPRDRADLLLLTYGVAAIGTTKWGHVIGLCRPQS